MKILLLKNFVAETSWLSPAVSEHWPRTKCYADLRPILTAGICMNLYQDQFLSAHDFPPVDGSTKTLIIASTPRSGSHMLGHSLHATQAFGFPLEYMNPTNLCEWKRRLGTSDNLDTLRSIQLRRTSPNGVFGIKLHYSHLDQLGGFKNLKRIFPDNHFVLLTRSKVLQQAVSHAIAQQTGVYITGQQPMAITPKYNYKQIDRLLKQILFDTASWRYLLESNGSNYIELEFEFVKKQLATAINQVANLMDIDLDPEKLPTEPRTITQNNNLNHDWEQRFLADYKGGALFNGPLFARRSRLFSPFVIF